MQPYYEQDGIVIYHGDSSAIMSESFFDGWLPLTVTDPPYGTGGWRRDDAGQGSNPKASLQRESWDLGATGWLWLVGGPVVTFWPAARTCELLKTAQETGRTKHRTLYMRKLDPKPQVNNRVCWSMEPIWILSADGFLLFGGDDVFDVSTPRLGRDAEAVGHPYQKPESVMCWLVGKLLGDEAVIFDPFMGSGTTLVASKRLGRKAVGIETEERYCEIAAKRLSQGVLSQLFDSELGSPARSAPPHNNG